MAVERYRPTEKPKKKTIVDPEKLIKEMDELEILGKRAHRLGSVSRDFTHTKPRHKANRGF